MAAGTVVLSHDVTASSQRLLHDIIIITYLAVTTETGITGQSRFSLATPITRVPLSTKRHHLTRPCVTFDPRDTDGLCGTADVETGLEVECVQSVAVGIGEYGGVFQGSEVDAILRYFPGIESSFLADVLCCTAVPCAVEPLTVRQVVAGARLRARACAQDRKN